jgi:hypothetical protein
MKTFLSSLLILYACAINAQITSPIIKAGFGVDGDVRANYFNSSTQTNDDWFSNGTPGTGQHVIDTAGAASIRIGYVSNAATRMRSFYRGMSKPTFSVVNNKLWMDALFVRDHHGTDTTVFKGGPTKNGVSPAFWLSGVQNVPDKNDILDVFMHVRRDGSQTTDSLWLFGGLSLDNVTGNRYFDFEMYQTDIYYDRVSGNWYGYGPDAGHTSWQFDASGNVVKPGDVIFSASYQSSSLSNIEARIWIDSSSLRVTPAAFNWSGQFDGDGNNSKYGYASILPKTNGTFYTGLQSGSGEWPGSFLLILQNNTQVTTYAASQFMEFSVNLTKLGLDPVTTFGKDICGAPFNRLLIKTRTSDAFTSDLKDFVGPLDLFLAPRVDALANVPVFCGAIGASNLKVQNPSASSVYTWTTPNGHIAGTTTGTSITVDAPGTYIVKQQLASGCSTYATDTLNIVFDPTCKVLANGLTSFTGNIRTEAAQLNWTTNANSSTEYFEVLRSVDGVNFIPVSTINVQAQDRSVGNYSFKEEMPSLQKPFIFYKLKIRMNSKAVIYSSVLRLDMPLQETGVLLFPNPASNAVQLGMSSDKNQDLKLLVYDLSGRVIESKIFSLKQGSNLFTVETSKWNPGAYMLQLSTQNQTVHKKLIVQRGTLR